jgi:hypothetical protein
LPFFFFLFPSCSWGCRESLLGRQRGPAAKPMWTTSKLWIVRWMGGTHLLQSQESLVSSQLFFTAIWAYNSQKP